MKGYYRVYVQREAAPHDWEMVNGCETADEAHASALRWEANDTIVGVRVDVCVRYFHRELASTSS